jgi:hypothetical protein
VTAGGRGRHSLLVCTAQESRAAKLQPGSEYGFTCCSVAESGLYLVRVLILTGKGCSCFKSTVVHAASPQQYRGHPASPPSLATPTSLCLCHCFNRPHLARVGAARTTAAVRALSTACRAACHLGISQKRSSRRTHACPTARSPGCGTHPLNTAWPSAARMCSAQATRTPTSARAITASASWANLW